MLDKKHYALIGTTVFLGLTSTFAGYKYYTASHNMRQMQHRAHMQKMIQNMKKHRRQKPHNFKNHLRQNQRLIHNFNQQSVQHVKPNQH